MGPPAAAATNACTTALRQEASSSTSALRTATHLDVFAEARAVVIPQSFRIAKRFQNWVCHQNLQSPVRYTGLSFGRPPAKHTYDFVCLIV